MEGPGSSMTASVGEHHHDAGPSNSSSVLSKSVGGGDGEGARVEKKRKGAQATAETKTKSRQDRSDALGVQPLGAEPITYVLEDLIDPDSWNEDDTSTVPARPADVNDRLWNSAELP